MAERPRHEPGLARRDEAPAAVQAEGGARGVRREGAKPGATEVAVVAGQLVPLAHVFVCLGSRGRSDKPGYYEGRCTWDELPPLKTKHFPADSILPKTALF